MVCLIIVVLVGLILPGIVQVRDRGGNRASCTNNLKQLGLALHAYHDVHGRFPVEDYNAKEERLQINPRWHEFSPYVSLLPYIEQGNQLSASKGEWMLVADKDTNPPRTGSTARPIKTLLCPSRRTTVVGPKDDYAAASQWSMLITDPTTKKTVWANSILGSAAMCAPDADQDEFTGTTLDEVSKADGTSNAIMLAHKAMNPADYAKTDLTLYDAFWGDLSQRIPYDHNRDLWDKSRSPTPTPETLIPPMQDQSTMAAPALSFGSPHPGAMPTLYCDGSVRTFAYSENGTAGNRRLSTAQLWQALWAYNDGMKLSFNQ